MPLRILANSTKQIDIDIDVEERFTADSGHSTIIPLSNKWKTLGIQVSGGLDSALLLYLSTIAIQKHNFDIKIQPISVYIPTKAKNIVSTNSIIDKIREITNASFINDGLILNMPLSEATHIDNKKNIFFNSQIRMLFDQGIINFDFNGNTQNPPESIRKYFKNDETRQKNRDDAQSIYNSRTCASPHYMMDKADIINLYLKHNIFKDISPMTISCDENIDIIHKHQLTVPCGRCWWCSERKYGHDANNVEDLSPTLTHEEYLNTQ
jgi:hypothetical protein